MSTTDFKSIELSNLPNILVLFLFIGLWLLASGIIILLLNLLGIQISLITNSLLNAFFVGLAGGLLWSSLIVCSIFMIERFNKKPEG